MISRSTTTKDERRALAERMKSDDELKLVIVRDMWLTGLTFLASHALIDKPMQGTTSCRQSPVSTGSTRTRPAASSLISGCRLHLKKAPSFPRRGGRRPATQEQAAAYAGKLELSPDVPRSRTKPISTDTGKNPRSSCGRGTHPFTG